MSQSPASTFRAPKSRAVTRSVEAGTRVVCASCEGLIVFRARKGYVQVIANVYEDGVWKRVEQFHHDCYDGRYGDAEPLPTRPGR